jgi:sulfatase modifying factor 1
MSKIVRVIVASCYLLSSIQAKKVEIKTAGISFLMGDGSSTKGPTQGSLPQQTVAIGGDYEMDSTCASSEEFAQFINETKYQTDSEKFGWSFVLANHLTEKALEVATGSVKDAEHWVAVPGASWQFPKGPDSFYLPNHPAVHLSYNDAKKFCEWKKGRLPTETEWEYSARGGLNEKLYPWGDSAMAVQGDGRLKKWKANVWQGKFPTKDEGEDGFSGTCPVDKYEPNAFGLYNMVGNVWEWTDTKGPMGEKGVVNRVLRGASFVDSVDGSFNHKATVNARMFNSEDSASSNTGVRCAYGPATKKGYKYPKEKPRLDQDILSKIAEEGGVEALQEYLGKSAQVMTAKDLKERKEKLEQMKKDMQAEAGDEL